MTDADTVLNFGSDPSDIRLRIRMNTEIWIGIPDYFWLMSEASAKVSLCKHSLVVKPTVLFLVTEILAEIRARAMTSFRPPVKLFCYRLLATQLCIP